MSEKFTSRRKNAILRKMREGHYAKTAAETSGITEQTLYNWLGHSEVSAKDILATPQDQEHADARSEAVEFLNEVLGDGPVAASQVKEEAEDADISERTLARAKKAVGVMSYREGESGGRGKGQWLWKLPVVDLVDDGVKDATRPLNNGGILNHTEGAREEESRISKPNSLRMPRVEEGPIKEATTIKDARVPTLGNGGNLNRETIKVANPNGDGTLKQCIHSYDGGVGCFLCDPGHPYRLKERGTSE
jgi:hypothetical protein